MRVQPVESIREGRELMRWQRESCRRARRPRQAPSKSKRALPTDHGTCTLLPYASGKSMPMFGLFESPRGERTTHSDTVGVPKPVGNGSPPCKAWTARSLGEDNLWTPSSPSHPQWHSRSLDSSSWGRGCGIRLMGLLILDAGDGRRSCSSRRLMRPLPTTRHNDAAPCDGRHEHRHYSWPSCV